MKKGLLGLLAAMTLAGGVAHAGQVYDSAYCYKNADSSGGCYGTFAGFRDTTNANDYAEFYSPYNGNGGGIYFYGSLANVGYSCTVNISTTPSWLLPTAMIGHSYFSVAWDKNANCTSTSFINTSTSTTK